MEGGTAEHTLKVQGRESMPRELLKILTGIVYTGLFRL